MRHSLVLSANAFPQRGGQGLNLYHVVNGLKEYFDISLFCRDLFPAVPTQVVPPSTMSTWIGQVPALRRLRDVQNHWSDVHFDHYVAQRLPPAKLFQGVGGQCYQSLEKAKSLGCRTVVDSITTHVDDFVDQQKQECAKFNIRPVTGEKTRLLTLGEYRRADLIRILSEHAEQTFRERGLQNVIVVRPWLDVSAFPQATFQEPKFRVSFVGLLEPWKGFHYLVDAFNLLDLPDSELVFWGGAGSRAVTQYLQEQMGRNPKIQVRPVEVRKCYGEVYAKSSVLVHPSLSEGFGYVVAEAMASGIPVIVTRNAGAADLVTEGKNGYIVPVRDPGAIRDRLAHLAAHPALVREMGKAARDAMQALDGSQWRNYARALEQLAA
jgi:glycosyltransferase involved in cell wall biosynthesis